MAETYREKVGALIARLQEPDSIPEAKDALRGLIDRIVLSPTSPDGKLSIYLEGALAALLRLGSGVKTQKGL
ncbi:recombinase family protein, partial [Sulfitobacter pseudonitzschiae]|nr:recombinase family protein [Pseudosulfitobacter pseudonitzschiae]MBM1965861.1 recombinase family protein [Pseudosulfitobacter pseudonitzschiae]MBM1975401.1 recombinase family protein [Pseudosulfitobacter pseudonitzschiae]MBM2135298.1 recombinase family protein [Pseudosulfitobacter pseudonitzschiae]